MLIASAGGPADYYKVDGKHKATPEQILHPIKNGTLVFCGLNVHQPFVALGVLGMDDNGRAQVLK